MITVCRPTVITYVIVIAVALYLLLCAVMVWLTKRLPIVLIPKQFKIAFMFFDVVNNVGGCCSAFCQAHDAEWMLLKIG